MAPSSVLPRLCCALCIFLTASLPSLPPLDAPQVCLQRNLPAGDKLAAAAESVYDGVQMVNGLECKLCNMQQKIKKVRCVRWAC